MHKEFLKAVDFQSISTELLNYRIEIILQNDKAMNTLNRAKKKLISPELKFFTFFHGRFVSLYSKVPVFYRYSTVPGPSKQNSMIDFRHSNVNI